MARSHGRGDTQSRHEGGEECIFMAIEAIGARETPCLPLRLPLLLPLRLRLRLRLPPVSEKLSSLAIT
jgi:hypothetical protein